MLKNVHKKNSPGAILQGTVYWGGGDSPGAIIQGGGGGIVLEPLKWTRRRKLIDVKTETRKRMKYKTENRIRN